MMTKRGVWVDGGCWHVTSLSVAINITGLIHQSPSSLPSGEGLKGLKTGDNRSSVELQTFQGFWAGAWHSHVCLFVWFLMVSFHLRGKRWSHEDLLGACGESKVCIQVVEAQMGSKRAEWSNLGRSTDETWLWPGGSEHSLWIWEDFMVNYVKGNMLGWANVNYSVGFIQSFENMEWLPLNRHWVNICWLSEWILA